jgi:peptide/nickel transport system permease protein
MVVVFFIVTMMLFLIFKAVPVDPVNLWLADTGANVKPEQYEQMRQQVISQLRLDQPLAIQYVYWISNLISGNMGYSGFHKAPVRQVVSSPIRATVKMNIVNLVLVFIISIPLGIRSAVKRGKAFDNSVQVVTILGYSLPTFITCILAIWLLAVKIPLFEMGGMATPNLKGSWLTLELDKIKYMILPLIVMTFTSLGGLTRYIRAAMIEALSLDCVRTARAKGLKEKVVIYSHAMRNGQITVITALTNWFIGIFGGSLMIENLFLWNGMGRVMFMSVRNNDWAVVFAMSMFYVLIALVGHLFVDLIYAAADPRIRLT